MFETLPSEADAMMAAMSTEESELIANVKVWAENMHRARISRDDALAALNGLDPEAKDPEPYNRAREAARDFAIIQQSLRHDYERGIAILTTGRAGDVDALRKLTEDLGVEIPEEILKAAAQS